MATLKNIRELVISVYPRNTYQAHAISGGEGPNSILDTKELQKPYPLYEGLMSHL
jgi:hypothetical protein